MGKREQKKLFNVRKEIISKILEKTDDAINRDDERTARKNLSIAKSISSHTDSYYDIMPKEDQEAYQKIKNKLTETVESYKTRFKKDTKSLDYKPKILSSLESAEMDIILRKEEDAREEFNKIEYELTQPYNNGIQGQEKYFKEWKELLQKENEKKFGKRKYLQHKTFVSKLSD